jgi:hypothetical protein
MTGIFNILLGGQGKLREDIIFVGGKIVSGGSVGTGAANLTVSITDLTGGIASAPTEDDIVVVGYARGSNGRTDQNLQVVGFNELVDIFSDDTYETDLCIAWKRMGYTPDTTITITRPDTGNYAIIVKVFRNIDLDNTIDTTSVTATDINGGQPDPPEITTNNKCVIIAFGSTGATDSGTTQFTSSDLDNFQRGILNGFTSSITLGGGAKYSDGGIFDPAQFGGGTTSTDAAWAAATIALRAGFERKYKTIEQVGSVTYAVDSSTITLPTGLQEGDLVIICSSSDDELQNLPTGYTNGQNGSNEVRYRWSYKFMGITPDSTASGLTLTESVHMAFSFRNVNQTISFDAPTPAVNIISNIGMPNPPSITTRTPGAAVIGIGFLDDDAVASSVTAPSGYTLIGAQETTTGSPGTTVMAAFLLTTTAGSYDPGAFGGTGTDTNVGATLALRPIEEV